MSDDGSHLSVLATQATQEHISPTALTYTEAKLYQFAMADHWRPTTIADDHPYNNIWIEDDVVQLALSVTRPNIKRYVRLVKKEVDSQ